MDNIDYGILKSLNNSYSVEQLSITFGLSYSEIFNRLNNLSNLGYLIQKTNRNSTIYFSLSRNVPPSHSVTVSSSTFRFLAISDTHYGSTYDDISLIDSVYEYASSSGISYILHLGDFIEGIKHSTNIRIPSIMGQVLYAIENYPYDPNIFNYVLFGNHDANAIHKEAFDISKMICSNRSDFTSLGYIKSRFFVSDFPIFLVHMHHDYPVIRHHMSIYPDLKLALSGHFHVASIIWFNDSVLNLKVPTLSNNVRHDRAGFYDITLFNSFHDAVIQQFVFDPDLEKSSEYHVDFEKRLIK